MNTLSLRTLPLLLLTMVFAAPAAAQNYPVKPIRIIVPYAPGGSTDVVFRILAPRLSENLGQQVLVENRPGAASTIGLDLVAKSAPDGYTVGVANIAYGANPTLYKKMPFDAERDLAPVSLVSIVTMVLSVHPSVPAKSVKQLIALGRKRQRQSSRYGALCAHDGYQPGTRALQRGRSCSGLDRER
jgi:tripartite-type tricarboxylate transporter receptor subunit TctC